MPSEYVCEMQVGPQGQLVMPSAMLEAMCWHPGDTVLARIENHRLVLEQRSEIMQRVQSRFASIPKEVNLADELIAERRKEAEREEGS